MNSIIFYLLIALLLHFFILFFIKLFVAGYVGIFIISLNVSIMTINNLKLNLKVKSADL